MIAATLDLSLSTRSATTSIVRQSSGIWVQWEGYACWVRAASLGRLESRALFAGGSADEVFGITMDEHIVRR